MVAILKSGWIKIHRKLMESECWKDPILSRAWIACLLLAGHKDNHVIFPGLQKPIHVFAGSFITGRDVFFNFCYPEKDTAPVSSRRLWDRLATLEIMGQVSLKVSKRYTVVSVVNWDTYQSEQPLSVQVVSKSCPEIVQETSKTCPSHDGTNVVENQQGSPCESVAVSKTCPRNVQVLSTNKNINIKSTKSNISLRSILDFCPGPNASVGSGPVADFELTPMDPQKSKSHKSKTINDHDSYIVWVQSEAEKLFEQKKELWQNAYPALILEIEMSKAIAWLDSNPGQRKKNIGRFLTNWFSRTQERGGTKIGNHPGATNYIDTKSVDGFNNLVSIDQYRETYDASGSSGFCSADDATVRDVRPGTVRGANGKNQEPGLLALPAAQSHGRPGDSRG